MDASVLAALISLGGVIISTAASCIVASSLTNWRLQQLEKKVDEYSKLAEKYSNQNTEIALMAQKIENINNTLMEMKAYIQRKEGK